MPDRSRIVRSLAATLLVIAGGSILLFGMPGVVTDQVTAIQYGNVRELSPETPGFPEIESHFAIRKIDRVEVSFEKGRPFLIDVAHYQNIADQPRQALIFLPDLSSRSPPAVVASDVNPLRWQAWVDASNSFVDFAPGNRLFITWWDNAQRIDLLSGEKTWVDAPVGEAFNRRQQDFWRYVSGGFGQESERLNQLAVWMLSDAEEALQSVKKNVEASCDLYFLVTLDDLARLSEMRALSGKPIPFETRLFRADENIHRLISRVKRWARERGNGSYLVQHLAGSGVRVWRITTVEGERTLLARLLPFTSSLADPIENLDLVYRSDWSGFLSIYRWNISRSERVANQADTR